MRSCGTGAWLLRSRPRTDIGQLSSPILRYEAVAALDILVHNLGLSAVQVCQSLGNVKRHQLASAAAPLQHVSSIASVHT